MVQFRGWNEVLAFPLAIYEDVFSVSGHCAHNLKSAYVNSTQKSSNSKVNASDDPSIRNGWHNIGHCMPNELRRYQSNTTLFNYSFYGWSGLGGGWFW